MDTKNKLNRYEFLSDYYHKILKVKLELEKKGLIYISLGKEEKVEFKSGFIEKADKIMLNYLPKMIDEILLEIESEMFLFFNK